MHLASEFGYSGVVELLLDAGAQILKDNEMDTPWILAKRQKRDVILDLFRAKRDWSDEADKDADFADKSQTRIQTLKVDNIFFFFFFFFSSLTAPNLG